MTSVYVVLAYIVMIAMQFTMTIPIIDTVNIGGYTLRYLLYYLFIYTTPFFALFSASAKRVFLSKRFFYAFFFIAFSLISSISAPGSFVQKTAEAALFLVPVALCCVAENSTCGRKVCMNWLLAVNIVAGVVSFLVATKIIEVNIWAAEGSLVRTAGAINGTLGVGGFIAALVLMFVDEDNGQKKKVSRTLFEIGGFLGSALVVLFSLSRTRIVLLLAMCAVVFVYNLIIKGTIKGNFKLLILLIVSAVFVFKAFPEITKLLVDSIQGRYNMGVTDENVDFRVIEMQKQLEMFKESPILGKGWGIRTETYITSNQMFIHNIFTSLLMHTGIVGTVLYLLWYFNYFVELIKMYAIKNFKKEALIGILFMISLTVLGVTNSGLTQSGAYFMMFYIAILVRDYESERMPAAEEHAI